MEVVMFCTPPNWTGLFVAALLCGLVLAVAPFVTSRAHVASSPHLVAACERTIFCETDFN
jgi:hypothetical protein